MAVAYVDMNLPASAWITEVGPSDGLQGEARRIPAAARVAFVGALVEAGHRDVQVASFFAPHDRVPHLGDAEEVLALLGPAPEGVTYGVVVSDESGLDRALAAGVGKVGVLTAATETFSRNHLDASIDASLAHAGRVVRRAHEAERLVRGYVGCAVACPYEGPVQPEATGDVVRRLLDLGCDEVSVGDTSGAGTPREVGRLLDHLLADVDPDHVVLHLHDTRGMAVANVVEGLRHGIAAYDASSGGLGGCPFGSGAAGTLATEDLLFLLRGLGVGCVVDLEAQRAASRGLAAILGRALTSRVLLAPPLPGGEGRG